MKTFAHLLEKAIERRKKLAAFTNAMRLVNGVGDGLEGLLIDRYHKHFQVQILSGPWSVHREEMSRLLSRFLPVEYLIVKTRRGMDIKKEIVINGLPQTAIEEHGLKFAVHLDDGLNCGLFLDMRHNRRMAGEVCQGKKVLNCFSYTCSFGLYARVGGAAQVINTDISRKILERGQDNYRLNGITPANDEFVKSDSMAFLQRAFKKGNLFDVIILDPPSFARYEKGVFQIKRDLPRAMAWAISVLNPGGYFFVSTNYSEIQYAELERLLAQASKGRRVQSIQRVGQDEDFPSSNHFKESYLVGLWVKFI